jgi:23S rRNA pseudouridine1911/1915/1917 synthase
MSNEIFSIQLEDSEQRLDLFISSKFPDLSRSRVQNAIKKDAVEVNSRKGKKSTILKDGDTVSIVNKELLETPITDFEIVPQKMDLEILFEDDNFLVINKRAGVVVHPGNGNPDGTLLNGVYHYLLGTKPRLIHRLDKDTTGVIMVAKDDKSHDAMSKLFADREVYKGYIGITVGRLPQDTAVIEAPLGRSKAEPIKRTIRQDGRSARTDYALLKNHCGVSVVAYRLHTGRTHQIRVHSAHAGFSIIMDSLYGGLKEMVKRIEPLERSFAYKVYAPFTRQALHARFISFIHPFTQENIEITAPFPADFKESLEVFELSDTECNVFKTPLIDDIEPEIKEEDIEITEYRNIYD